MTGTRAAVAMAILIALGGAAFLFLSHTAKSDVSPTPISGPAFTGALTNEYRNDTYHFSLSMPANFSAKVIPAVEGSAETILLENAAGEGIQISMTPHASDARTLTTDDIREALPDLAIENPEPLNIGTDYRGVAFLSDNAAFDGASREVWFYFRGTLYQISTYARLDGLLKAMFATWKFL